MHTNLKLTAAMLVAFAAAANAAQAGTPKLWYQTPAKEWMEAVPLGNGRIGAMVFGGIDRDRIALNEVTLWAGQRDSLQNDGCGPERLAEIRRAFFSGDLDRGNELTQKYLTGHNTSFGTHLPLGEMVMEFEYPGKTVENYRRELDLSTAVATTTFTRGGVTYTRSYICDYPDDVMAVNIAADRPGAVTMTLSTDLLRESAVKASSDGIYLDGKVNYPMFGPGGVEFAADMRLEPKGGTINVTDGKVKVTGADAVTIYIDVRTDYDNPDYASDVKNTTAGAAGKGFAALKANTVADHSALFNRMDIRIGKDDRSDLPTDVRLRLAKNGAEDPDFDALFFQYGRYMQIASSRPNSPLASNLQGIWNDNLACHMAWTCDYHLDININQNYWSPNRTNLAECNVPMFNYVKLLEKYGSETARKLYGCRGWCAHTVTNPWGFTAPGGYVGWALCPTAGAWLATELWSHYLYTLDTDYLRDTGYPLLKSCAEFFTDYLVEDPNTGYLVSGPSISPENGYRTAEGKDYPTAMGVTIDRNIVEQIYTACIESSKILGVDKKFAARLKKDIRRLPPLSVGSDGQVKEWLYDVNRSDPSHRHSSHLTALYPFGQISASKTPELMAASAKGLDIQTASANWEDTEWSTANMLCFQAFLKNGNRAHSWLQNLFKVFTRENLMTVSPAGVAGANEDIFSFDATEASVAGMCDMLLQSHDGFIEFLPALPDLWQEGEVKGICARGAIEADLAWNGGKMKNAELRAGKDTSFNLLIPKGTAPEITLDGKAFTPKAKDGKINVTMKKGQKLNLSF